MTAPMGLQSPAAPRSTDLPLRFLCFASEWDSAHGGVSTFNRDLCIALASNGQEVYCAVPSADDDVRRRAQDRGVTIVSPEPSPGDDGIHVLYRRLAQRIDPDVLVGHGRFTGRFAASQQRDFYPNARRLHVLHTDPFAIEVFKEPGGAVDRAQDRLDRELALAVDASVVAAVGPVLHRYYATYLHGRGIDVHEIQPGIADLEWEPRPPLQFIVLLFGRVEDARLKGLDVAIEAMRYLMKDHPQVCFRVMGAAEDTADEQWQKLRGQFGAGRIILEKFTADREKIVHAIRGASVVILPSREEGYGLAALEAIAQGVPVQVSANSGFAETMLKYAADALSFVVPAGDAKALADGVERVHREPQAAFSIAARVHASLRVHLRWEKTACQIVELLRPGSGSGEPPGIRTHRGVEASSASETRAPISPHAEMANLFGAVSGGLAQWPTTLPSGEFLERPEQAQIASIVGNGDSFVLLLGDAGSGKSALLARLARQWVDDGSLVLCIKADQLLGEPADDIELGHAVGLPYGVSDAIDAAANLGRVVVVVDQLDALADLVDYRTERLDALLELIDFAVSRDGVSVVASSRTFEANHDLRIASLEAQSVQLGPLSLDAVGNVLGAAEVTRLPDPTRQMLRLPLWLSLYVDLRAEGPLHPVPRDEYGLMEVLWGRRVAAQEGDGAMEGLLGSVSQAVERTEELWVPTSMIGAPDLVEEAVARRLLRRTADGARVGFAHQRLFEFSRVRQTTAVGLAAYAVEHQDGLAVRRTLWPAMQMCRSADPSRYRKEFEALSVAPLRLHLRVLLAEFVGSQRSVRQFELQWILAQFAVDAVRRRFFNAIRGNDAWFRRLADDYLPAWMSEPFAAELVGVLAAAWRIDRAAIAELIKAHWLPETRWQSAAASVVSACADWDEEVVELADMLARSGSVNDGQSIVRRMLDADPSAATRTFVALLEKTVRHKMGEFGENADAEERQNKLTWALENMEVYQIEKYGEAAPRVFLEELGSIWDLGLVEGAKVQRFAGRIHEVAVRHLDFFDALERAFCALAEQDRKVFGELVGKYMQVGLGFIQSVLCEVLARVAEEEPGLVVEFLRKDPRRLLLETESWNLLRAVGGALDEAQLHELEGLISLASMYEPWKRDDPAAKRRGIKANRAYRLRLLEELNSNAGEARITARVEAERAALGESYEPSNRIFSYTKRSSMSAEQMEKAQDAHILKLFDGLPDSTEWDHPMRLEQGGSIEASRELSKFAEKYPQRALNIVMQLEPGRHERPAAYALEGVAKSGSVPGAVESTVWALEERGFRTPEFRTTAARALHEDTAQTGLSGKSIDGLSRWLAEMGKPSDGDADDSSEDNQGNDAKRSILWRDRGGPLPHGTWPVLEALTHSLLYSPQKDFERLESILLEHANRADDVEVWRTFLLYYSRSLRGWGPSRARTLIDVLFDKQPGALESTIGLGTLAYARWWAPESELAAWVEKIRSSSWTQAEYAAGELVGFVGLHSDGHQWARAIILERMSQPQLGDDETLGIVQAAARLWDETAYRVAATNVLTKALADGTSQMARMALSAIDRIDMRPDSYCEQFLTRVCERKPDIPEGVDYEFASQLARLVEWRPLLVCDTAKLVVERGAPERVRTEWLGTEIVRIALTAHRLKPTREKGLELFEEALGMGVWSAQAALASVDGRGAAETAGWLASSGRRPRRRRR